MMGAGGRRWTPLDGVQRRSVQPVAPNPLPQSRLRSHRRHSGWQDLLSGRPPRLPRPRYGTRILHLGAGVAEGPGFPRLPIRSPGTRQTGSLSRPVELGGGRRLGDQPR